jgi:hypothetical protein
VRSSSSSTASWPQFILAESGVGFAQGGGQAARVRPDPIGPHPGLAPGPAPSGTSGSFEASQSLNEERVKERRSGPLALRAATEHRLASPRSTIRGLLRLNHRHHRHHRHHHHPPKSTSSHKPTSDGASDVVNGWRGVRSWGLRDFGDFYTQGRRPKKYPEFNFF